MSNQTSGCSALITCTLCPEEGQCQQNQEAHSTWLLRQRFATVGQVVLVMSNKGGVGKSTVATNLAVALAEAGLRVGLGDLDLSGPSLPTLLGLKSGRMRVGERGLTPLCPLPNLKVASLGFMLPEADTPVMLRDSFKYEFLSQLLGGVDWGELDLLVLDMPPGTGGEFIGTVELVGRAAGAVVVTTPQELALTDVRRAVAGLAEASLPLLGIVENMGGLTCPHCGGEVHPFLAGGGEALAQALGAPFLGRIPLDPATAALADQGQPVVLAAPHSPAGHALAQVAAGVLHRLQLTAP